MWNDLGYSLCGRGWVPIRGSHFLFWSENPHKELAREISYEIGRRRGKEGPRAEQKSGQTRAVGRREQELGPAESEAGLANVRGWVSVPGGFVGISLEYTLTLAHRCRESHAKVLQTSPFLCLELTQVRVYLFSFIPSSRLCMLCFVCP